MPSETNRSRRAVLSTVATGTLGFASGCAGLRRDGRSGTAGSPPAETTDRQSTATPSQATDDPTASSPPDGPARTNPATVPDPLGRSATAGTVPAPTWSTRLSTERRRLAAAVAPMPVEDGLVVAIRRGAGGVPGGAVLQWTDDRGRPLSASPLELDLPSGPRPQALLPDGRATFHAGTFVRADENATGPNGWVGAATEDGERWQWHHRRGADGGVADLAPLEGDVLAVGTVVDDERRRDAWAARLTRDGRVRWHRTVPGARAGTGATTGPDDDADGDDAFSCAIPHPDGVLVGGYTDLPGPDRRDARLAVLAPDGDLVWDRAYPQTEVTRDYEVTDLATAADGRAYAAGRTIQWAQGNNHGFVFRVDDDGQVRWRRQFDPGRSDLSVGAVVDRDGPLVVGWTDLGDPAGAVWLGSLASDGGVRWLGPHAAEAAPMSAGIAAAGSGDQVVVGGAVADDPSAPTDPWLAGL